MTHYICTECGGEASIAGVCQTEECKKEGEALLTCDCGDGLHSEVKEKKEEEQDE
ncbi:MAG: hypothetical protein Q7R88_00475 [bacterium]|nr:hypothetical protein [bacterium]